MATRTSCVHERAPGVLAGSEIRFCIVDECDIQARKSPAQQSRTVVQKRSARTWKEGTCGAGVGMRVVNMMRDAFGAFRRRIEYIIGRFIAGNVASSPMFDRDWYVKQNPDIRKNGIDPADHYRRAGWLEGRLPSPNFKPNTRAARWLWRYVGGTAIATRSSARLDADWQFLQQTRAETARSRVQTRIRTRPSQEPDASGVPQRTRPHAA